MINLYTLHPTSSFTVYPDADYNYNPTGSYALNLTQDYDQSFTQMGNLKRLNTDVANKKSHLIVLEATSGSSRIPSPDGQYTGQLLFGEETPTKWGEANVKFGAAQQQWGNFNTFSGSIVSTDRAYVHGANLQTITTNTSTDQTGAYTTYND
jgi:hypothetical protein|tara:strand:+ start:3754 stop:4209 length:456 start_codon:yes stop_codon:yes gene_type:complete